MKSAQNRATRSRQRWLRPRRWQLAHSSSGLFVGNEGMENNMVFSSLGVI